MSPLIRPPAATRRATYIRQAHRQLAKTARWAAADLDGCTSPHAPGREGRSPRATARRRTANRTARVSRRINRRRAA